MSRPSRVDSRELGLAAGLVFARFFLNTEHLHYGYWPDDLEIDISNLRRAQENYSDFLFSHIPEGTKDILDVGCGTGVLSRRLLDKGYHVESVSPSPFLTSRAGEVLGGRGTIHESTFEELQAGGPFDLVMFAESFQYIKLDRVFDRTDRLLRKEGYVLICDFFRRDDAAGASGLGGGHNLGDFRRTVSDSGFTIEKDLDITDRTAPSMDVVNDLLNGFGKPMWELFQYYLTVNYPKFNRILKWKYRKKIRKLEMKYFSGMRNAESFKKDKSYRLVLCRRTGA